MDLKFGIEEEFFVVDAATLAVEASANEAFIARANEIAGGGIARELLQAQVETSTPICTTHADARRHLRRLRHGLAAAASEYGLAVIAAGTHPTAQWPEQRHTPRERYDALVGELQLLAYRNLVCGMHVHVEVEGNETRIDLMRRAMPFLPLLLLLSCSSPFWRGMDTGFSSYRHTAYDELPRTGLPPLFASWSEYAGYTSVLERAGIIRNPSFIWWSIRPSYKYPTLELRIPDACTNVEDSLTIAALYRCLLRALMLDPSLNAHLGSPERALVKENKWCVQRFGRAADIADPFSGHRASAKAAEALRELAELLGPHAAALGCSAELERIGLILAQGTSADTQSAIYGVSLHGGGSPDQALSEVTAWLGRETLAGVC
jgi:carboxylate-amine ligase